MPLSIFFLGPWFDFYGSAYFSAQEILHAQVLSYRISLVEQFAL